MRSKDPRNLTQSGNESTYKVHADGRNVRFSVGVVCESKEQTGLSYTRVSNKEQLEEVIAVVVKVKFRVMIEREKEKEEVRNQGI